MSGETLETLEIGVRELRDRLSAVLAEVRAGRTVTITDRNRPIARLTSLEAPLETNLIQRLAAEGAVAWGGGRLSTPRRRPRRRPDTRGGSLSDAVIEDRR